MTTPVIKYPYDPTGISPNNLVVNEQHTIPIEFDRVFALDYGPFYSASLEVTTTTGQTLKKNVDYRTFLLMPTATAETNMEVCAMVQIVNEDISGDVLVTYQVVGGQYSIATEAINQLIELLVADDRQIEWLNVKNRPAKFPPSDHYHSVSDLYGFEHLINVLSDMRTAILTGDSQSHIVIYQKIANLKQDLEEEIARLDAEQDAQDQLIETNRQNIVTNTSNLSQLRTDFDDHAGDKDNPHGVTKDQVGLGSVENYGVATDTEATAGTSKYKYMTPYGVALYVDPKIDTLTQTLNTHVNNKNNPHSVTKAQVGLGSVDNYATANNTQAITGTATNLFMTPATTMAAINSKVTPVSDSLNDHIADKNNPHAVTKAQVGLGSVQNYGVATTQEAQAGTATNKYMTPALTAAAIASQAGALIQAHIDDKNNPHAVTKTQVGLGNVPNYAMWNGSFPTSPSGLSSQQFISPYNVYQMIARYARLQGTNIPVAEVTGAVPTSRTINGKPLSSNITLTADDIGGITTTIKRFTGSSGLSGLTAGKVYAVSVYGIMQNRGTGGNTFAGIKLTTSTGSTLVTTGTASIDWPDGNPPASYVFYIVAPSNGIIYGYVDDVAAKRMEAAELGNDGGVTTSTVTAPSSSTGGSGGGGGGGGGGDPSAPNQNQV